MQPSYRSGKLQINPRTTAKDPVKMMEETGTNVSISTVKRVLYRHNLKGRSARKKPQLQNRHEKPDYGLQLHMGTKIVLFGETASGQMNQKENCLAIMTIAMFGGKMGRLASRRTQSQPWSMGVLCCRRDWCTSQNRWHHEERKLCGYIEATSQDVSQEVKAWPQMGLPNEQWPQAYFQSCGKMA